MSRIISLWPDDLLIEGHETPPIKILRDQAEFLAAKTKDILTGEVRTRAVDGKLVSYLAVPRQVLNHSFYVKAPLLDNYRYELFSVRQDPICLYPVTIVGFLSNIERREISVKVENEQEYLEQLKIVLGSDETKRVISSLLQSSLEIQKTNDI